MKQTKIFKEEEEHTCPYCGNKATHKILENNFGFLRYYWVCDEHFKNF